jgi:hypothetical protein
MDSIHREKGEEQLFVCVCVCVCGSVFCSVNLHTDKSVFCSNHKRNVYNTHTHKDRREGGRREGREGGELRLG